MSNAGNRRGSYVIRGTQDGTPARSDTFCPKVLAGIDTGKLPDTVRDRALVVDLERKMKSEPVERLRVADLGDEPAELRERLSDWAAEHHAVLAAYRCEPIPEISDRLEEGWEPLLAIAVLAGEDTLTAARAAAVALGGADDAGEDHGQVLLVALRDIFDAAHQVGEDAALTADICSKLNHDDEMPFGGYRRGEGIEGRRLASLLRLHGIRPKNVRVAGDQGKGYEVGQFAEVWERYAPPPRASDPAGEPSQASHRPTDAANRNGKPEMAGTDTQTLAVPGSLYPSQEAAGTDRTGPSRRIRPRSSSASQTALASGKEGVRDGGTDGTDDPEGVVRGGVDKPLSPYDPEVA